MAKKETEKMKKDENTQETKKDEETQETQETALQVVLPRMFEALTPRVATALATLSPTIQKNLVRAVQPLAPAKKGLQFAEGKQVGFPFVRLHQKSTENCPPDSRVGEYFTDAMETLGGGFRAFVLFLREERVLFSGAGGGASLVCRSPDRKHSIRGVYCEDCNDKPVFRREDGKVTKYGGCDDTTKLVLITDDFSHLFQFNLSGKWGQETLKMIQKLLLASPEVFARAYQFGSVKKEAGTNTYISATVAPAKCEDGSERVADADELIILDWLCDNVLRWARQDHETVVAETHRVSGKAPGMVAARPMGPAMADGTPAKPTDDLPETDTVDDHSGSF